MKLKKYLCQIAGIKTLLGNDTAIWFVEAENMEDAEEELQMLLDEEYGDDVGGELSGYFNLNKTWKVDNVCIYEIADQLEYEIEGHAMNYAMDQTNN